MLGQIEAEDSGKETSTPQGAGRPGALTHRTSGSAQAGARPTQQTQNLGFKSFTFLNAPTQAANEMARGHMTGHRIQLKNFRIDRLSSNLDSVVCRGKLQPERSDFSAYGFAIGTGEDRVLTMVELVRAGRSADELAKEFEPTAKSIRDWVAQADGMKAAVRTA